VGTGPLTGDNPLPHREYQGKKRISPLQFTIIALYFKDLRRNRAALGNGNFRPKSGL